MLVFVLQIFSAFIQHFSALKSEASNSNNKEDNYCHKVKELHVCDGEQEEA